MNIKIVSALVCVFFLGMFGTLNAQSVPNYFVYEGRLLDNSGSPVTSDHEFRFSFWKSSDFIIGDVLGSGAINIGSANYGGWQESHVITPINNGFFSTQLGTITLLPQIDNNMHKYVQRYYMIVKVYEW